MTDTLRLANGLVCPAPPAPAERIQLGHGSGGKLSAALLRERFLPHLANPVLQQLGDAAVVPVFGGEIAFSTDTFVVSPLEFPGGNIGSLAVHGTLNDVAMMGAVPRFLSAGFVIEEGLEFAVLDRVIAAMAAAARAGCGASPPSTRSRPASRSSPVTPRSSSAARPTGSTSTRPASARSTAPAAPRPSARRAATR